MNGFVLFALPLLQTNWIITFLNWVSPCGLIWIMVQMVKGAFFEWNESALFTYTQWLNRWGWWRLCVPYHTSVLLLQRDANMNIKLFHFQFFFCSILCRQQNGMNNKCRNWERIKIHDHDIAKNTIGFSFFSYFFFLSLYVSIAMQ